MSDILFHIEKLKCQYRSDKPIVLDIDSLTINHGEVVFFLGTSGSGKSTILESMGLMNNTITHGDLNKSAVFDFYPDHSDKIDFFQLWRRNKEMELSAIRRNYFSFIFQSTNLFGSLSAEQNVGLPAILEGFSEQETVNKTHKIFNNILKDVDFSENDIRITELSGGQRQRLAFSRAIISDFNVLFADEPTGNLDYYNANLVMRSLVDYISNNTDGNNRTVIIVTHDIDLALKFATKIVFINRIDLNDDNKIISSGKINKETIFIKNTSGWSLQSGEGKVSNKDFYNYLRSKFDPNSIKTD